MSTREECNVFQAAEQGNARSQCTLGVVFQKGRGVEKSDKEAFKWYTQAADQGNASSQRNLGVLYKKGQGIEKNYKEAVKWFTRAAKQDHATSQCNLGFMYYEGQGIEKSYNEAVKWFTRAADKGNASSQCFVKLSEKQWNQRLQLSLSFSLVHDQCLYKLASTIPPHLFCAPPFLMQQ